MSESCLFCRIVRGEIPSKKVFEDDDVFAFEDINPQAPVHVLVIPRLHVASTDEIDATHEALVGRVILRAAAIARDRGLPDGGYRLVTNCGEAAGQSVFHLHFHLLGGRPFRWPPG